MADKSESDKDTEVDFFTGVRAPGDEGKPVMPVRLKPDDRFAFRCHQGVACWNRCCHGADVTLTPYDILSLSRHLGVRPREFLAEYTVPAMWESANLPVAKLKMAGDDGKGACRFLADEGCTVYENRPATCRYYPLGLASIKFAGDEAVSDFSFLVKESYCLGHEEDNVQSVTEFRDEQGVDDYDRVNRGWMDILMKMASWRSVGGPGGQDAAPQVKQMFFMVSTDVDGLREFVMSTKFLDSYDVDPDVIDVLKTDDEALLQLGFDWMKNVLFNEPTIRLKERVMQDAIARARSDMGAA